jgi:SPP1 family predicted phage head-tail adaptor
MANPGKLNRRLTVQSRTFTRDATGGVVETWADAYPVWAELVNHSQDEKLVSDADRNIDTKQFRIRYKTGLASGSHRVLYQLKFYDIESVTEEGIRDRLLLKCRAAQALEL